MGLNIGGCSFGGSSSPCTSTSSNSTTSASKTPGPVESTGAMAYATSAKGNIFENSNMFAGHKPAKGGVETSGTIGAVGQRGWIG